MLIIYREVILATSTKVKKGHIYWIVSRQFQRIDLIQNQIMTITYHLIKNKFLYVYRKHVR